MIEKKHNIIDRKTMEVVGYTTEGPWDTLLVYMDDGVNFHGDLHGSTHNFYYYCKWYAWDCYLELCAPEPKKLDPTPDEDLIWFVDTLHEVFEYIENSVSVTQVYLSEQDILNKIRQELNKRSLENRFICSDVSTLIGYGPQFNRIAYTFKIHARDEPSMDWRLSVIDLADLAELHYDEINNVMNIVWEQRP